MGDNVVEIEGKQIERAMERHPAGKRRGPAPGTPNVAARERAEQRRLEEARKARPISADTKRVQGFVLTGVVLIGAAAFAISYGALYEVAAWTGWEAWQSILTPILLDLGIIVFTFLSFIRMERHQSAVATFLLAETLTLLSAGANVLHTLDLSDREGPQLLVACAVAALPPLILSASSYLAGRTIFRVRKEG